jgi:hypothetical protein
MSSEIDLAGIEYHGVAGSSHDCQTAIERLLQFGDPITRVRIISQNNSHCLLLTKENGDQIAVKSGFSSGYGGTGPTCFSYVLQILNSHGAAIDECETDEAMIDRLDCSGLTTEDLESIENATPVRPSRWHDYVHEMHYEGARAGAIWREFPLVVPFAVIDTRIADLALSFWENPDDSLLKGYRRLEDVIRKAAGLSDAGERLFSRAFMPPAGKLQWRNIDESETVGRAQLFTGAFKAHRNPRAHKELKSDSHNQLTEFLLLNHLYRLEKEASPRQTGEAVR